MDVGIENTLPETLEELLQRHRKEKKELQSKIQAVKKTAIKGDKKKCKEVSEEVSKMENEMKNKHRDEVADFESRTKNGEVEHLVEEVNNVSLDAEDGKACDDGKGRPTKASKRRAKKVMLLKEQELRIAEQEAQNLTSVRHLELQAIQDILRQRGLMLLEIPSDGDCLYNAVSASLGDGSTVTDLRKSAAKVLRQNEDEYLPFLSHPDTGEILTSDQYKDYCSMVENTPAWGGQIELKALSEAVSCCIEVVQGSGPPVIVGSRYKDRRPIIITYHRHLYGLGEHYNSVQLFRETSEQEKELK